MPAVVLHALVLTAFLYHTWTWFHIMPRTLPPVVIGGSRVSGSTITRAGLAAALAASALAYIVIARLAP